MTIHPIKINFSNHLDKKNILNSIKKGVQIENTESIELSFEIANITLSKYNDIMFELTSKDIVITIKLYDGTEDVLSFTKHSFDKNEEFAYLLDDKINEYLLINKSIFLPQNADQTHFEWIKFNSLIHNSPSLESLYFQIKNDQMVVPENHKPAALYKILLRNDKVNDIFIVEDFITNFFNIKYAELILKYPSINKSLVNMFITHPDISPIVLLEYHAISLDFGFLNETTDPTEFVNFFYTKVLNAKKYHSEFTIKALEIKNTPQEILDWLPELFDIAFIVEKLLNHKNCSLSILNKCIEYPSYGLLIFQKENIHEFTDIINRFARGSLFFNEPKKIIEILLNNPNISDDIKSLIARNQGLITNKEIDTATIISKFKPKINSMFAKEINAFFQNKVDSINSEMESMINSGLPLSHKTFELTKTLSFEEIDELKESLMDNLIQIGKIESNHNKVISIITNSQEFVGNVLMFTPKDKSILTQKLKEQTQIKDSLLKKIL